MTRGLFGASMLLVLVGQCASMTSGGIVGDQVPMQYPVVDVHVPEPVVGRSEKQWANELLLERQKILSKVQAKLDAYSTLVESVVADLNKKMEAVLSDVESKTKKQSSNTQVSASTSFLGVVPVDGYKIRNSLYLTQVMRSPPQASINIVEHEDLEHERSKLEYKALAAKAHRLMEDFRHGVEELSR
eukprot:TRINITY_DN119157_c0_g1_i1.p1 TRINITY_DN119157_c0_g1~~TRINITY_DN119157_c0_g1_i1.p1  ORF type:complete len:201 (-),score=30.74 TRINITY_DN119157_c0_g1_i1:93-653(-)